MGLAVHEMLEASPADNTDESNVTAWRQPAAMLPLRLVLVRMQRAGYPTVYEPCHGQGRYCVLTVRDVESDADLAQLADLPQVASLIPVPRRLVPERLNTPLDLRRKLAEAHIGDVALLYSIDTQVQVGQDAAAPFSRLKRSLQVDQTVTIRSRLTAALVDIRTGFVYLHAETNLTETLPGLIWSSQDSADRAHQGVESRGFHALISDISQHWSEVITPLAWRP
jgi:hypothetical protein